MKNKKQKAPSDGGHGDVSAKHDKLLAPSRAEQTEPFSTIPSFRLRKCQVLDMCEEFKVSQATAYRHVARGTTPAKERKICRDGISRPVSIMSKKCGKQRSRVERDLLLARQALNRAERKAEEDGVDPDETALLSRISALAVGMLNRWEVQS
jgi:hypothetical protein